jgi:predicted transposase YbfD/YdcC
MFIFSSLIQKFKTVKDFRSPQGKRHSLDLVLTIILLSMLCGNTTYKQIEQFRAENEQKLIKSLNLVSQKLPSYSTIRRVMMGIKEEKINALFNYFVSEIYADKDDLDWIAIDGKTLKNTINNYGEKKQNQLIMVSFFSQNTRLIINSDSFEGKKGSEIHQVQAMIKQCGLINKVFTLDALHCNKITTKEIISSKNDYLITVKRNQIKLFEKLESLSKKEKPLSVSESIDNSHSRKITRKISVFDGEIVKHKNYPHLKSFIKVIRSGNRGKKPYEETVYYISSLKVKAEIFAQKIKNHWLIENQLHWVKDVIFGEDKLKIKDYQTAHNWSILISIIMNIQRVLGFLSIKKGIDWFRKNWQRIFIWEDVFG